MSVFCSLIRGHRTLSVAELDTLLLAAASLDYLRPAELEPAQVLMIEMRRLLQGLIQKLRA